MFNLISGTRSYSKQILNRQTISLSLISLLLILLLIPSVILIPIPLNADVPPIPRVSIHQLAGESNLVIVGTVTAAVSSQVTVGADTILVTDLTTTINESLVGSTSSPVTIRIDGGTVNGITMVSSTTPYLIQVGTRAVFFLSSASMGRRTLIRKGLGLLQLRADNTVVDQRGLTLTLIRIQCM